MILLEEKVKVVSVQTKMYFSIQDPVENKTGLFIILSHQLWTQRHVVWKVLLADTSGCNEEFGALEMGETVFFVS